MRLYLQGESENKIGYTVDWIAFYYKENDTDFRLTLDLQGETDYSANSLHLRFKGDAVIWEVANLTNDYILVDEEANKILSTAKVREIISKSDSIFIGLYPAIDAHEWDKAIHDKLTNRQGKIELGDFVYNFADFDWEIPL